MCPPGPHRFQHKLDGARRFFIFLFYTPFFPSQIICDIFFFVTFCFLNGLKNVRHFGIDSCKYFKNCFQRLFKNGSLLGEIKLCWKAERDFPVRRRSICFFRGKKGEGKRSFVIGPFGLYFYNQFLAPRTSLWDLGFLKNLLGSFCYEPPIFNYKEKGFLFTKVLVSLSDRQNVKSMGAII